MSSEWLVIVWRLPHGPSTPRVTIWRALKSLGAACLTPGAALLPFGDDHLEQLGWIAQEVEEMGGEAWVLPVDRLTEAEEAKVRTQVREDLQAEYREVADEATALRRRAGSQPPKNRELVALQRRLERIRARDHFDAAGRFEAIKAVENLAKASRRGMPSVALGAT